MFELFIIRRDGSYKKIIDFGFEDCINYLKIYTPVDVDSIYNQLKEKGSAKVNDPKLSIREVIIKPVTKSNLY